MHLKAWHVFILFLYVELHDTDKKRYRQKRKLSLKVKRKQNRVKRIEKWSSKMFYTKVVRRKRKPETKYICKKFINMQEKIEIIY